MYVLLLVFVTLNVTCIESRVSGERCDNERFECDSRRYASCSAGDIGHRLELIINKTQVNQVSESYSNPSVAGYDFKLLLFN